MAGQFVGLFQSSFSSATTVTVTHNLDRAQVAVIARIGDVARNDLVNTITPQAADPRNVVVVVFNSAQTGEIIIIDTDYIFAAIPSPESAAEIAQGTVVTANLVDAKGDLLAATADNVIARLPVGTDTHVLMADSAEASGIKWAASGGGAAVYVDYYGSGSTSVGTSATTLGLDTSRQSDAAFVLSSDEVTVQAGAGGDYRISFDVTFDESDSNKRCVETWLEIDGSEVVAMRARGAHTDSDIDDTSGREAILTLAAGEVLRLRSQVTEGSGSYSTLTGGVSLLVHTIGGNGPTGQTGATGSGSTIAVKDDGVLVAGGPHDTINFVGMDATDAGSGTADITNVYGSGFSSEQSEALGTTTLGSFGNYITLTTASVLPGIYKIVWSYTWSYDNTGNDFLGRLLFDGSDTLMSHRQEPKDSSGSGPAGTNQRFLAAGFAFVTLSVTGTHTFELDFASAGGHTAAIYRGALEFLRVE